MQSRLIVKNFGPIDFVDLDLRNVNVFIGPQASGKSALAKLFTIFKAPRKFLSLENQSSNDRIAAFKNVLEEYNIVSFLKLNTEIIYDSVLHRLSFNGGKIAYEPKLYNKITGLERLNEEFTLNKDLIQDYIIKLCNDYYQFEEQFSELLGIELNNSEINEYTEFNDVTSKEVLKALQIINKIEIDLSSNSSLYIPAERSFINIIKNSSLNLLLNNVPIPKHILIFGAELEKVKMKSIDLSFLSNSLSYRNINGEDRIFINRDSIKLSESASGIQSIVPVLLIVLSHNILSKHRSLVIEEPELNLFPTAQYELIKLIESKRIEPLWEDDGAIHTYTTHSPYIISAFNNLLYANKVLNVLGNNKSKDVKTITTTTINPNTFTAYQIKDGTASSIFDREAGLIVGNYIDEASDKMSDDFDALTELMKK